MASTGPQGPSDGPRRGELAAPRPSNGPADPLERLARLEGVASALQATRDGIDALLRDRGHRRTTPELTTRSLLLGAQASAALEGEVVDVAALESARTGPQARAAVLMSTELLGLGPVWTRSPLQALARLHALAAGSAGDGSATLGRPRDVASAARLRALAALLTSPTRAPALLVAAVVHAELVTAAPFERGNGLVARAAERLVLVTRGVDPASLVVPEAGHLDLRREYASNLRGYRDGGPAGVHSWLLYAAQAYARGAERSPLC